MRSDGDVHASSLNIKGVFPDEGSMRVILRSKMFFGGILLFLASLSKRLSCRLWEFYMQRLAGIAGVFRFRSVSLASMYKYMRFYRYIFIPELHVSLSTKPLTVSSRLEIGMGLN